MRCYRKLPIGSKVNVVACLSLKDRNLSNEIIGNEMMKLSDDGKAPGIGGIVPKVCLNVLIFLVYHC